MVSLAMLRRTAVVAIMLSILFSPLVANAQTPPYYNESFYQYVEASTQYTLYSSYSDSGTNIVVNTDYDGNTVCTYTILDRTNGIILAQGNLGTGGQLVATNSSGVILFSVQAYCFAAGTISGSVAWTYSGA